MKVVRDGLWLCVDCSLLAQTGDATSFDYHYGKDADKRLAEVEAGLERLGPHLVADYTEWGEGYEEFKRPLHGCACCQSTLAGTFHRFAVLGADS